MRLNVMLNIWVDAPVECGVHAVVGVYFVVQQFRYGFLSVVAEFSADVCVGCFPADFFVPKGEADTQEGMGSWWDRGWQPAWPDDALYALGR